MTILSATTVKTFFETGDKPTQSNFEDLIDTAVRDSMVAIATAAEGGATGIIAILGSTEATAYAHGAFGRIMLTAGTTASASNHLGIAAAGAVGALLQAAIVTASAQGHLGAGAIGIALIESIATASVQNKIGTGTFGRTLLEAITTASAANHLNIVAATAASIIIQVTSRNYSATESTALSNATNAFVNTQVLVSTTPASSASKFLVTVNIFGHARDSAADNLDKSIEFTLFSNGTDVSIAEGASAMAFYAITSHSAAGQNVGGVSARSINASFQYIDSPSTIGTVTYRVKVRSSSGNVAWVMNTNVSAVAANNAKRGLSTITLMEMAS